jgi:hypothetical protein
MLRKKEGRQRERTSAALKGPDFFAFALNDFMGGI